MTHKYADIAFTPTIKRLQQQHGSRKSYARMEQGPDRNHILSEREAAFIAERDSFYMATVTETGWPYMQHRGGPKGFLKVLDERTIGFADFRGNKQYISTGNLQNNDRVSLFLMDYPHKARLKMLGRAKVVGPEDPALLSRLELSDYKAVVERAIVIHIEGFDWNCPQHITPRFTLSEIEETVKSNPALLEEWLG